MSRAIPETRTPSPSQQEPLRDPHTARGQALQGRISFQHTEPQSVDTLPLPPLRVLVVDDDPDIRDLVTLALLDEGYEVASAANGAQALQRVLTYPPDVILLDMQMPEVDGPTFAQRYRGLPGPHAPIVVFTAAGQVDRWLKLMGGAADVVEKPFDLSDLSRKLTHAAREHAA